MIRSLDDLDIDGRQNPFHRAVELGSLLAAVGKELDQERKTRNEQARHQQRAAVAVLDVGGVDDRVHQQALRIDEDVALPALDLFSLQSEPAGSIAGPLFRAHDALAVDDHGGSARFARGGLAALRIKPVVDANRAASTVRQGPMMVEIIL